MTETPTEATTLYCYVHPTRETSLRCNNCDSPICASCAVRTPTGYRCRECVKSQQKTFDTSEWVDYVFGFIAAGFLSGIASLLVSLIGRFGLFAWLIIFFGAPTAAAVISEGVRLATRKHRSQPLFITVAVGVVLGALPVILFQLFAGGLFGIIYQIIYLVIAVPIIYARLSGIQFNR